MNIQTKFHGQLNTTDFPMWTFPNGLPGLVEKKDFILIPIEGNDTFQVMQSALTPEVALIVSNPYTLISDYSFEIDEPTLEQLEIKSQEDVMVLVVMTIRQPFESSTVNLQAPLIFNINNQKAKQMILNDTKFDLRQSISEKSGEGAR